MYRNFGYLPGPDLFARNNCGLPIFLIPILQHGYQVIPRSPSQVGRKNRDFCSLIGMQEYCLVPCLRDFPARTRHGNRPIIESELNKDCFLDYLVVSFGIHGKSLIRFPQCYGFRIVRHQEFQQLIDSLY